jgi:hypothetical protein
VPTPDSDHEDFDSKRLDSNREDRFEAYLKQFHPLAGEPLQLQMPRRATRRSLTLAAWAAAAAVILIALMLVSHPRRGHTLSSGGPKSSAAGELADSQPLTIGSANALLTHAPSVKEALDRVPFHSPSPQLPKGTQSALAVLSENKDKL